MHSSTQLVLCHRTADFDALGAAVGIAHLNPGARIVLCGGAHPAVKNFLALYRDEFPLIERRSVNVENIREIIVVDAQRKEQLGSTADWLTHPQVQIQIWDHHLHTQSDIEAATYIIDAVGATSTLVVERIMARGESSLSVSELTVMALGIHVDTGSLTYDSSTPRDASALAWLMKQGANQRAIADYVEPGLSLALQEILSDILEKLETVIINGHRISWVLAETSNYVPGLSSLASQLIILSESDAVFLGNVYPSSQSQRLTIIARSRIEGVNVAELLHPYGGGGHAQAAAVALKADCPREILSNIVSKLKAKLPIPPMAMDLMSSPVRTIRPETTIDQARRILLRYGHSGLSVVDASKQLVGIISRRDLDIALHHGFGHAPVKGYMTRPVHTVKPETSLPEIETLMVNYDIGRLPVVQAEQLVGIVTRTDILRQLHHLKSDLSQGTKTPTPRSMQTRLDQSLASKLKKLLQTAAKEAEQRRWQLYLVGGAVRDLLLATPGELIPFKEFDLVVDGAETSNIQGAGGTLGKALQKIFTRSQLQIYGQFQTAALVWHDDPELGSFSVDIATARSEFYPYPAANPEVSVSSIRQDLYRRDFTINALAIRLTTQRHQLHQSGELLDFFGGLDDLEQHTLRVLHPNSFIEDPTRIFRAIRFATRLAFSIDTATLGYMETAIASGLYRQAQENHQKTPALQARLRNEFKYIFSEDNWRKALTLIGKTHALSCLHPELQLTAQEIRRINIAVRWQEFLKPYRQEKVERWLIIVETLLTQLSSKTRQEVANHLHLPEKSQERLQQIEQISSKILPKLNQPLQASQGSQILRGLNPELLILLASQAPLKVRQNIWHYLTTWQFVQPLINGQDLIELGYQPGKSFRHILQHVLDATLDRSIATVEEAKAMVQKKFPLS